MSSQQNENNLEKSGYSYLENSQILYPDEINQIPNIDSYKYHFCLHNYQDISKNQRNNIDKINHFQFTDELLDLKSISENSSPKSENKYNKLEEKHIDLINDLIRLSKKNLDKSNKNVEKKNIFITKSSYVGFKNSVGDNSCYINVVLHVLHNLTDVSNILKDIAQIKLIKKESGINDLLDNKNNNNILEEDFLSKLGEILDVYDLYECRKKQNNKVTLINNYDLRQKLDIYSNHTFKLNQMADPVELLLFILVTLNNSYKKQIHKNFYLNLIDQNNCPKKCKNSTKIRFDKDNFSYHIYINELLNYIKQEGKRFKDTKGNLFDLSLDLYKNEIKICETCSVSFSKYLICYTKPKYLLINCIWEKHRPEKQDILDFLFLLSVEENLNHLFICDNSKENTIYNLLGMILYSHTLSHYIVILYNKKNKVFVLHDDTKIIECKTLFDCFSKILIDYINLYDNDKAYFCPTMLIYTNENIYDKNDVELNQLSEFKYVEILNKIDEQQNDK